MTFEPDYHESSIALRLGQRLRLVGTKGGMPSMPVYPMPRLVRHAAFMGMDLLELDVPASWGQQALKYARTHGLEKTCLEEAFASTIAIEAFRGLPRLPRNRGRQRGGEHAHRGSRCG